MALFRGTSAKNRLVGGAFSDTLIGLDGADTLTGKSGVDKLSGGAGNDLMNGGTGADKLSGEAGDDRLGGGSGNDVLDGGTGDDRLAGGSGNDRLTGGAGNDIYAGGAGRDVAIVGSASADAGVRQSGTSLVISGVNGIDTIGADVELVRFTDGLFAATAQTLKLTATQDTLVGGLRDDTFRALINTQNPNNTTYSGGDVLDGGIGTDTIEIRIAGTGDGASAPPITLTRIENVRLLNQESNGGFTSIDASLWSGVTSLIAESGLTFAATEVTGVGHLLTVGMTSNDSSLTIEYAASALAGADDVQALVLAANRGGTFEVAGGTVETLEIISRAGDNTLELAAGHTFGTVRITGSQHLEIDLPNEPLTPAVLTTFDASGMTGGGVVAHGLNAASGVLDIRGSLASDQFAFVSPSLDGTDKVDGGGGQDVLSFVAGGVFEDASFTSVERIETLMFDGASTAIVTLDAQASAAGFGMLAVRGEATGIDLTIGAGFTRDLMVDLDAADAAGVEPTGHTGDTIDGSAMQSDHALTVVAHASSLAGGAIVAGANGADVLILEADGGTADLGGIRNFETVQIAGGSGADASRDIGIYMGDDMAVASGEVLTIDAAGASGLIDASAQLFFDGALETDGAFHVTAGNGDDTLIGSGGDDTLAGGTGDDTIDGGAGDDIIFAGAGSDTIRAGVGSDTIDLGAEAGAFDTDRVILSGLAPTVAATISGFDAATGASSEDVIVVEGVAGFAAGGLLRASAGQAPGDVRLIVLDDVPSGFAGIATAAAAADLLQDGEASADRYLFVWNDTGGAVHVSLAQADSGLDAGIDLAALVGVSLGNIDLSDFNLA